MADTSIRHRRAPSETNVRRYRVKDVWRTIQGEGTHAGAAAVFVRLVACNVWSGYDKDRERDHERTGAACALFCDTDFTKEGSRSLTAAEIADEVFDAAGPVEIVVISGGEPLLQLDPELVACLQRRRFRVHVETNGTQTLHRFSGLAPGDRGFPDWITCSPKYPDVRTHVEYVDEVKLVVPAYRPDLYPVLVQRARQTAVIRSARLTREERLRVRHPGPGLFVQPEDGPRFREAVQTALDIVSQDPDWRISTQTHKALDLP
jgi:organic radical activating enzyme